MMPADRGWGCVLFVLPALLLVAIASAAGVADPAGDFLDPDITALSCYIREGILYGGGVRLLGEQALANGSAIVWSFGVTLCIMILLKRTIGVRVDAEAETTGLDLALHSETAYHGGGLH